jgi:hypothetical protein
MLGVTCPAALALPWRCAGRAARAHAGVRRARAVRHLPHPGRPTGAMTPERHLPEDGRRRTLRPAPGGSRTAVVASGRYVRDVAGVQHADRLGAPVTSGWRLRAVATRPSHRIAGCCSPTCRSRVTPSRSAETSTATSTEVAAARGSGPPQRPAGVRAYVRRLVRRPARALRDHRRRAAVRRDARRRRHHGRVERRPDAKNELDHG